MSKSELEQSPLFSVAIIYSAVSAFGLVLFTSVATLMNAVSSSFGKQLFVKEALVISASLIIALCGFVGAHGFMRCFNWGRHLLILFHLAAIAFAACGLVGERLSWGVAVSFLTSALLAFGIVFVLTRPGIRDAMLDVDLAPSRDLMKLDDPISNLKESQL